MNNSNIYLANCCVGVVMNSRKVKLAVYVTDIGEMRNAHKILITTQNGPNSSGSLFPISS
jgi:hypothetical protein